MTELRAKSVVEFLTTLRKLDVEVWVERDRLRCRAHKGVITPFLQEELAHWKPELIEFLERTQNALHRTSIPLRRISRDVPLPASFGQQRLWFLQELDSDSYAYNIPGAVRICGPLDVIALEKTLDAIVQRHETLRTTFRLVDGALLQSIGRGERVSLNPIDLTQKTAEEREQQVRQLIASEAKTPFSVSSGPHWRISLIRLSQEEHVLIIVQHHIISDGWSLGIFVREMGELYDAFVAGLPSPLRPLAIQYADFAYWQRQWLSGDALHQQLNFWRRHLQGPLPVLNLPTDRPRPKLQSFNGSLAGVMLPASLSQALKAFSQQEGATLFMTLLAAFNTLLHRYTDQVDLVVGTSNGNRNHVETESLIGFFVNTLALRTNLAGRPSFREVVARVRQVALAAYDHQDVPFERLVEELQPVRDLGRSPVFQVMFILHNTPTERLELRNLTLRGLECDLGTSKFDLTLNVTDLGHGLATVMEYNTDLFDAATIRRLLSHFQTIAEQALANPDLPVDELPLLTATETSRILRDWNATAAPYSSEQSVYDLFSRQVARHADRVAVESPGRRFTYRELNERVNALAECLLDAGVQRGHRVGLCLDRSLDLVAAMLAVFRCGAAYVPLDLDLPARRLSYILDDARVTVVIVDRSTAPRLPIMDATRLVVDEIRGPSRPTQPIAGPGSRDSAYLMYTSGSTGQPKAVTVSHGAVVNFLESMRNQPGFDTRDILLAVTPISFDISVLELLLPLVTGGQVVIANRVTAQDPQLLAQELIRSKASVMQATPATWKMLVDSGWAGQESLKILCGGEALPPDLARQLLPRCGSLWNMYGPTETTVWSALQRVSAEELPISIGRPIQNTQIYLLDSRLQPVPVGVPGELFIGGDGLADGYAARPGLTAEKFLPHPFSDVPGQRIYRTGDLARYLPGGRVEFLGRIDGQVKLCGFRIELGEIETTLRADAAVRNAVVTLRDDVTGPRLVAYVVPATDGGVDLAELRGRMAEQLPSSMLPSEYVLVDSLPLTPSGKIDRRVLPAPPAQRSEHRDPFAQPRNEMERAIFDIWCQLLPAARPGIHDNFFDLGGHSLLLAQMQRMIADATGKSVSLVQLFQYPTIAAIAHFLLSRAPAEGS